MLFIFFLPVWVFGTRHRDLLSAQGFSNPIGWSSRTGGWEGGVVFYSKGSIMCKRRRNTLTVDTYGLTFWLSRRKGTQILSVDKYVIRIRSSCSTAKFRSSYNKQAVFLDIQRGNIARRRSGEIYFCLLVRQHRRPKQRDAQDILANLGDRRDTGLTGENAQNVVQKPGRQTLG